MGASSRYLKQPLAVVLQRGFKEAFLFRRKKKLNFYPTRYGMQYAPQSTSVSEKLVTRQAFLRGTPQLCVGPPRYPIRLGGA